MCFKGGPYSGNGGGVCTNGFTSTLRPEFIVHSAAAAVVRVTAVAVGIAGLIITVSLVFVATLVFGACVVLVLATGIFTAGGSASIVLQIRAATVTAVAWDGCGQSR